MCLLFITTHYYGSASDDFDFGQVKREQSARKHGRSSSLCYPAAATRPLTTVRRKVGVCLIPSFAAMASNLRFSAESSRLCC
jgi:hypothetical protein